MLTFGLREMNPQPGIVKKLTATVSKQIRTIIADPNYPEEFLWRPVKQGGTGISDPMLTYATLSISGAVSLLNCSEKRVASLCRYDATRTPHNMHLPFTIRSAQLPHTVTHSP